MNEPRTIIRCCADCGKWVDIKLSGKKHWWNERKIMSGGKYFFRMERPMRGGWFSDFKPYDYKPERLIDRFLERIFWWWTPKELKCSVPNWKKPYIRIKNRVENILDPTEKVEYWECDECYNKSGVEDAS